MQRLFFLRAVALSLPFLLFACRGVPNADYSFMGRFQRGETRMVIDSIKNEDPAFSYDFAADGSMKSTHVDLYKMTLSSRMLWYWALIGLDVRKTKYDFIVFAYQNDKLIFAGTADDFRRHSNPELVSIGSRLNDALLKEF